jgi:hypothetical protein
VAPTSMPDQDRWTAPPMERVAARGPSGRTAALTLGIVAACLFGAVAWGRAEPPAATDAAARTLPARHAADDQPAPAEAPPLPRSGFVLSQPGPGASLDALFPVEVDGRTRRYRDLRLEVRTDEAILGTAYVRSNRTGRFHGWVPLVPVARPTSAALIVREPRGRQLARIEVGLTPSGPLALSEPRRGWTRPRDGFVAVSGATQDWIGAVRISLREEGGPQLTGVHVGTVPEGRGTRSFQALVALPPELPEGALYLSIGYVDHSGLAVPPVLLPIRVIARRGFADVSRIPR